MSNRIPAVAGSFYPDDAQRLAIMLEQMLTHADQEAESFINRKSQQPKVLVVPHAGYSYSGSIAAMAYHEVIPWAETIHRVVLLGPSHRVALRGMALADTSEWQGFETPLGTIELDCDGIRNLVDDPDVYSTIKIDNQPHYFEHSLEVQLPFLQMILKQFKIIPIVVGQCDAHDVARILEHFYRAKDSLIIISSDLSHFHDYQSAQEIDANTNQKILHLEADIVGEQACGCYPLNGLLSLAKDKKLEIENLALFNSGDNLFNRQSTDKSRVVGYGAYVVH